MHEEPSEFVKNSYRDLRLQLVNCVCWLLVGYIYVQKSLKYATLVCS